MAEPAAAPTEQAGEPEDTNKTDGKAEAKDDSSDPKKTESGTTSSGSGSEPTETTATEDDTIRPPKKTSKPKSLIQADDLLLKNKFEDAEEAYRGLITGDETGDAYAGLAVALAKQKLPMKVQEAEKIVKKGFEQFNNNPNMVAAGGYVAYVHSKTVASPARRDQFLEAAENLSKKAVKSDPETVIAQQTLGLVRLTQDDPDGAIGPLRKAAKMSEDPNMKALLAEALLKADPKDAEAKELVDEALDKDENCHAARLQKAIVLANKGKAEEAYSELHTIPRAERDTEWYRVQGDVYRVQGDGPSALASWKESSRMDPRNPEPYKRMAEYYAMRGDGEFAIASAHDSLEILPNDLNLRTKLAELALRLDKLEVAEQEFRTILSAKPEDATALLGLSRVFFRKSRREGGQMPQEMNDLMTKIESVVSEQTVQGQVIKNKVKNLTQNVQLSEAEKALGQRRYREAHGLFSQVITSHKEEPYELLTLGDQAYNDGDLKSAEEAFSYAKEIPEVATRADQGISKIVGQRNEAKRHTDLGNATWKLPEIAIDHYKQALIHDPQHPSAYYGLYKLYFRTKKDDNQAIDYAHTFLEASDDSDPLRKEVEDDLSKLKKRVGKGK